jgi:chorismate synthase
MAILRTKVQARQASHTLRGIRGRGRVVDDVHDNCYRHCHRETEEQRGISRETVLDHTGRMSSISGQVFRVSTFGESHGPAVGVVLDGCPPRLELTAEELQRDLDRRRPGQSRLVTQRDEADQVEILSGVIDGLTLGTPIAMMVRNADHRSGAYDHLAEVYRPSHADYTYDAKYGIRAVAGGGRSSARETIGRVAAGAVARKLLSVAAGIEVLGWVSSIHDIDATSAIDSATVTFDEVEADPTRCPSPEHAQRMTQAIEQARRDGDSLGGIVTCVARGVPAGLGDPVFDKLEATLAKAVMSLPASKGFEIGSGFAAARMTGRTHNDPFIIGADGAPHTTTNHSGGVQGGISNGETIVIRVAFKPTATINSPQQTVTTSGEPIELSATGRHDPCVLPRAVPLVEAAILLTLADHWLIQKAVDVLGDPRS